MLHIGHRRQAAYQLEAAGNFGCEVVEVSRVDIGSLGKAGVCREEETEVGNEAELYMVYARGCH